MHRGLLVVVDDRLSLLLPLLVLWSGRRAGAVDALRPGLTPHLRSWFPTQPHAARANTFRRGAESGPALPVSTTKYRRMNEHNRLDLLQVAGSQRHSSIIVVGSFRALCRRRRRGGGREGLL
ncbi:hypothetical protein EVAR_82553_1 [Eumeta japonica]|uniref:Secreted protein n=1 Tax=Eumeta variegata TaxID=151549 RepID=A0A4C1UWF1_EUMVA|nr:hypothetical protein EVAR_82553_1 [Eumeta japonica]